MPSKNPESRRSRNSINSVRSRSKSRTSNSRSGSRASRKKKTETVAPITNSNKFSKSDKISICWLILLYTLQGIPLGMSAVFPMMLKDRGEINILTFPHYKNIVSISNKI